LTGPVALRKLRGVTANATRHHILCLGGAVIDRKYRGRAAPQFATSNPVDAAQSFGGVARNVAETLARLGVSTALATLVGEDGNGTALLDHLAALNVQVDLIGRNPHRRTAEYIAVLEPEGRLLIGLAEMAIFEDLTPGWLGKLPIEKADWVFADCNLPPETLNTLLQRRRKGSFRLAVDAVSAPKAKRLPQDLSGIDLLFLNRDEAAAIADQAVPVPVQAALHIQSAGAARVVVMLGAEGCLLADQDGCTFLPAAATTCVDVTGAGDALIGGCLWQISCGAPLTEAVATGMRAAALTIASDATVRPDMSPALLGVGENLHAR